MSQLAISVESLSKSYLVGHNANKIERNNTLRDILVRNARNLSRKTHDMISGRPIVQGDEVEEFWALKGLSFTIAQGDRVGVIGRNGAGKSTLLKVLSRITEPTAGRVTINGRVASLLEVGTGFHPELSGRENVFLNGAILGMKRIEIQRKFDEIVAFAEVERFLDTPVKRYSSGMYVRLAFAVAAHLDPEILIVDEVLAVGDVQFQKKCLGKMQDVSAEGRTILFVSHNMAAIEQLTQRAIFLNGGEMQFDGETSTAIAQYLQSSNVAPAVQFSTENAIRPSSPTQLVRILELHFDRNAPVFYSDEPFTFVARLKSHSDVTNIRTSMTIFSNDGTPVGSCFGPEFADLTASIATDVKITLPTPRLAPGLYYCGVAVGKGDHISGHEDFDIVLETLGFEVRHPQREGGTLSPWPRDWGRVEFFPLIQQVIASEAGANRHE